MKYIIRAALMALSIATIPPVLGATLHDTAPLTTVSGVSGGG